MNKLQAIAVVCERNFRKNAATFEAWVEQFLVTDTPRNAIVVMDNLSAHKGLRVRELIQAAGDELLYLPTYSPELNPPFQRCSASLAGQ